MTPQPPSARSGLALGAVAYAIWGFLPLYLASVAPTGAIELIGWRILMSVAFCAVLLVIVRGWGRVLAVTRDRSAMLGLAAAGALVAVNWLLYVWAVLSGHTVEGALGYFLNPLVSVVLGLVVLGERMRPLQWAACVTALVAVVVLAVGYGQFPWLSIGLALTFGTYGLVKKRIGARVDSVSGFFVETTMLVPVAAACIAWAALAGGGVTFGAVSPTHTLLIVAAGAITSVPLLLFAAAASRITLVEIGMLQFIAPILQFLIGVFLFREAMPVERWVGFAIVWVALALFVVDLVREGRQRGPWRGSLPAR